MGKKARTGLIGTLAMRVLSISFLFVATPLLLYTIFLYSSEYRKRLKDVFVEMYMVEAAQKKAIDQMQVYNINVVTLIKELVGEIDKRSETTTQKELTQILESYAEKEGISALMYLEVEGQELVCKSSTNPIYKGIDFSPYFNIGKLEQEMDNVFIAEDPSRVKNMYVAKILTNPQNEVVGAVIAMISLDSLLKQLSGFKDWYEHVNLSILDSNMKVMASTSPIYVGKTYEIAKKAGQKPKDENEVLLRPMQTIDIGYKTVTQKARHFLLLTNMPRTSAILMITTPSYVVVHRILDSIIKLAIFLVCILVAGSVAAYLFTRRMARPMHALNTVMTKVGEGNLDATYKEDRYGFEINYLGNQFNEMTTSLQKHIEELQVERASKEAYEKELQIGHQIQKAILPDKDQSFPELELKAFYQSAKEVAGDFYDWMALEEKVMINIADGVGKGVSSCLYSFDLRSMLRSFARSELPLKDVIQRANRLFCEDTKDSCNFVTAFITLYDRKTHTLSYSNCGHLPMVLIRADGAIEMHNTDGMALGINDAFEPEVKEVQIEVGDICVLYTDGITEAQDTLGNLYGEDRFIETLKGAKESQSEAFINTLLADLQEHTASAPQYDDITLVFFKRIG